MARRLAFGRVAPLLAQEGHHVLAEDLPGHQVILVGHSMAGLVLHRVGEAIPQLISQLAYLSAWMTANGKSFLEYAAAPEMAATKISSIVIGDPVSTGALRIDFGSPDPAYRALVKSALAADLDDDDWDAAANLLTPDTPAAPMAEPVALSAGRWGAIPRTYYKLHR